MPKPVADQVFVFDISSIILLHNCRELVVLSIAVSILATMLRHGHGILNSDVYTLVYFWLPPTPLT